MIGAVGRAREQRAIVPRVLGITHTRIVLADALVGALVGAGLERAVVPHEAGSAVARPLEAEAVTAAVTRTRGHAAVGTRPPVLAHAAEARAPVYG